jgi:hypothetical protein
MLYYLQCECLDIDARDSAAIGTGHITGTYGEIHFPLKVIPLVCELDTATNRME